MASMVSRLFNAVLPRVRPYSEMGVSGTPVYAGYVQTAERNPKLIGQERFRTFADILTNTAIVAAGVRYFLNVVSRPSWSCEPANESAEAKKYAEFVENVLFEELHTPWSRIVSRAGTYRFHGFHLSEWTAKRRDDGQIGYDDIESRPQWTIWRWEVDDQGTVVGAWQRNPMTGTDLGLPRGKLMYLVDDTLTDTPEGMGLLRHCVAPAERLKEYLDQEAVGFLRDLRGIPVGRAPIDELDAAVKAGAITAVQKAAALDGLKDFITLEKKGRKTSLIMNSAQYTSKTDAGITIANAPKWSMDLITGVAPGLSDVGVAIDRLNHELARILSAEHLLLGGKSSGSFALSKEKATDLYLMANSVLRDIRLQAQHDLIWPLWALNGYPDELMPNLKTEDVTPKDVEQVARVMRDMATAGNPIPPDDEAINFVRDLLGAPHLDLKKYETDALGAVTTGQSGADAKAAIAQDKQDAADAKAAALGKGFEEASFLDKAFNPNQPRDKSGKWTSGGESGGGDSYIQQYLKLASPHSTKDKFILENGQGYKFDASSFEGPRDQPKLCYMNAGRIVLNNSSRTYVEGYINFQGIPIQHAWTVDKDNKVHDTTLKDGEGVKEYFGVPFKTDYVAKTALKTKVWGVISHTNMSLFKTPSSKFRKFDPNEPRDEQGRWTIDGSSSTPAADLLALHHDGTETMEDVNKQLTPAQKYAAAEAEAAFAGQTPTNVLYMGPDGHYTPERAALHNQILSEMFSKEDVAPAIPKPGEKPVLTLTGGRPASGKTSTLKGELGDTDKHSFYISADTIQEHLPGYNGKTAGLFNGEAQDIALQAESIARKSGLNITYDATLKSQHPALDRVKTYHDAGYDVHGYFVHTSPVESAVRSAQRYMDTGRYVPPKVSFNSTSNEKTFDALIPHLDKWALYDNNGAKPKRVAGGVKVHV